MDILYKPEFIFHDYEGAGVFIFSACDEELLNNAIFQLEINEIENHDKNYTYNVSKIFNKYLKEKKLEFGSLSKLLNNNIVTINNFNILVQLENKEYYFIWPREAELEAASLFEKEDVLSLDEYIIKNLLE